MLQQTKIEVKKIIAFSGSNSTKSINQTLIKATAKLVSKAEIEVINLIDYPAIMFSVDEELKNSFPQTMVDLKNKLAEADGYIISTPEHNGSLPAFFKNAIDWLSRQSRSVLNDNPTVFLSTSPGGRGGKTALNHLVSIMPYQGAKVIGAHSVGNFNDKVINEELIEGEDKTAILKLVKELEDQL